MRVRAIADGFIYGGYKKSGDEFVLKDAKLFSEKWMKKVEDCDDPVVVNPQPEIIPPNAIPESEYMKKVQNSPPPPLTELEAASRGEAPAKEEEPEGEEGPPSGDQYRI